MTNSISIVCALVTTFIWGTAFIAQDTGMDNIGPLTFNATRFFVGFLSIIPFALLIEKKKISEEINNKTLSWEIAGKTFIDLNRDQFADLIFVKSQNEIPYYFSIDRNYSR